MTSRTYGPCCACEHGRDSHEGAQAWADYLSQDRIGFDEEPDTIECSECGCEWYEDPDEDEHMFEDRKERQKREARAGGVTIGVEFKIHIVNTTGTCTCGWVTTQETTDRVIVVSEWHLKSHMDVAKDRSWKLSFKERQ